ncbi:signal transduction histidine kinase [Rhizobium sp. BK313]|uniref:sensor histidine kinase n=1 Tax=Rhizobium sp. BK313 TaxID=2587081 RepID=UPI00179B6C99|nr:histidine kinase [Rhizobium sp. BK313]MBB3458982.1 signal transduction histidine kinase [Rhizobium sp. BK313]
MTDAPDFAAALNRRNGTLLGSLSRQFRVLRLETQFIVIASIVVVALMFLLGVWTTNSLERAALKGVGTVGARYLQTFVAPLIEKGDWRDGRISPEARDRLQELLGSSALGQHVREIKIWNSDGSLFYSTSGSSIEKPVIFPELKQALGDEIVVSRTTEGEKHPYDDGERAAMYIEVYAPLVRDSSGTIVLVGEFYEEPEYLSSELTTAWESTLLIVGTVTIPMLAALYLLVRRGSQLIDRQHEALRNSLRRALNLSRQNKNLRIGAEHARMEAGKLNEKILDQIGGELHDGPVQVLTLIQLRLSDLISGLVDGPLKENLDRLATLTTQVLDDLRNISTGLVLPELTGLCLSETIRLAIARHTNLVGTPVDMEGEIDETRLMSHLNICAYRFVQEALMNAHRHAPRNRLCLRYAKHGSRIFISVADIGNSSDSLPTGNLERIKLGKLTQKRRIHAFGGCMRTVRRQNGTFVIASLPAAEAYDQI